MSFSCTTITIISRAMEWMANRRRYRQVSHAVSATCQTCRTIVTVSRQQRQSYKSKSKHGLVIQMKMDSKRKGDRVKSSNVQLQSPITHLNGATQKVGVLSNEQRDKGGGALEGRYRYHKYQRERGRECIPAKMGTI